MVFFSTMYAYKSKVNMAEMEIFHVSLQTGEGYFEAFKNELEAFKMRVRICSQSQGFQTMLLHDLSVNPGLVGELTCFSQVGLLFLEINLTKVG